MFNIVLLISTTSYLPHTARATASLNCHCHRHSHQHQRDKPSDIITNLPERTLPGP